MKRLVVTLAVLALAAAGCGGGSPKATGARPSSPAKITILSPTAGHIITGSTFSVKINLIGGRIVRTTSTKLTPTTQGHVHVSVDGNVVTMTYGLMQTIATPKPGKHLLQAEFVAKDHGPFNPRVLTSVPFEVR